MHESVSSKGTPSRAPIFTTSSLCRRANGAAISMGVANPSENAAFWTGVSGTYPARVDAAEMGYGEHSAPQLAASFDQFQEFSVGPEPFPQFGTVEGQAADQAARAYSGEISAEEAVTTIEQIVLFSEERYFDTATLRMIAVGRHTGLLVMVTYEEEGETVTPVTIHSTTRQQVNLRVKTGRFRP